jgi:Tfp pilus assembly protein FimT
MTLVELLLVLALLVIIGSIVVPVFTGSFSSVRLRRAGDQVLARWSQTRARAIETGDTFQFRFTPNSGAYRIERWLPIDEDEERAIAASPISAATDATSTSTAAVPEADPAAAEEPTDESNVALPDQIIFQGGQLAVENTQTAERQIQSMHEGGNELSTPILFFPDGTTTEASVVLANDRRQFVRLTVRGLTGVGRASAVLTREELDRYRGR